MGMNTVIMIRNDAYHIFKENPKEFGEAVLEAVHLANRHNAPVDVPFRGYANYIEVFPSRHASHDTVYVHTGNGLTEINIYSEKFKDTLRRVPSFARSLYLRLKESLSDIKELAKKEDISLAKPKKLEKTY